MKNLTIILSCMWLVACDGEHSLAQTVLDGGMVATDSQSPTEQGDMSGETDLSQIDASAGTHFVE